MHLKEDIDKALQSKIVKLGYDGHVLGLRVKFYDFPSGVFCYYDFDLELLSKNTELYNSIKEIQKRVDSCSLIKKDGRLYTESELQEGIEVGELTDITKATEVLTPVVNLYKRGYI